MKKRFFPLFIAAAAVGIAGAIVFSLPTLTLSRDETVNRLLKGVFSRALLLPLLTLLIFETENETLLRPKARKRALLWCIPALFVALANFPFFALFSGGATVTRVNLIPLLALYAFIVGAFEELFFRGVLFPVFLSLFKKRKNGYLFAVLLSAAAFSLWHVFNLFGGAGVGETLLQVGYTFLLGCLFAVTLSVTETVYYTVLLHALFDFGGALVPTLGQGVFQDVAFWVATAVFGVLCGVHTVFTAVKRNRKANERLLS